MSNSPQQTVRFADLSETRAQRVVVAGKPILLVRSGAQVHGFSADCPHAGAPLEDGALCNGRIVCPWHKGTFEISDGALVEPPALKGLDRYPVFIEDGSVWVSPEPSFEASIGCATEALAQAPANAVDDRLFVVIGSGAAGAAGCAALRDFGFSGRIAMVGPEKVAPYDRTALSKFVPSAEMAPQDVPPLLPADFFSRQRVERIDQTVSHLDAAARRIEFDNGQSLVYDAALIASGGIPQPLDLPGADLRNIHLLRNLDDAAAIAEAAAIARQAVVLGSSFIGLEVASGLRKRGVDVTVVSPEDVPFANQFGQDIGHMFKRLHEANGVTFVMGQKARAFNRDEQSGAVSEVVLDSGTVLPADLVIVGTGVKPATHFIDGVSLNDEAGVVTDASMQAGDGLYAAGDIAVFPLEGGLRTRIEHWRVAQQQARVAARNMAGGTARYEGVPFFWTYHYGKRFEYLGHAEQWDDILIEGSLAQHDFIALMTKAEQIVAVVACGREDKTARLAEAMREALTVDQAVHIVR
ncbi:MAG: FAD-dependent oxidoreductase [Janthinobacterium lividum]